MSLICEGLSIIISQDYVRIGTTAGIPVPVKTTGIFWSAMVIEVYAIYYGKFQRTSRKSIGVLIGSVLGVWDQNQNIVSAT